MLEIIPLPTIKEEEPENESAVTVITLDDDTSVVEFIKEEPLIDSWVEKVKVEKTTIDIADIRPSSSSAEKEREETAKRELIMLEIIPLPTIKEEEPENESAVTVITIDDDTSVVEFIKEEPLIDSFVKKLKVEKTTIDIADIRPSSSSAKKEREETAKEPFIDSFVEKVKVEKTTIDIADIRPSSSSAKKEREETAKEPLIDSFVKKVKVEKTTIDIADIRPSSSSAEKEREETAKEPLIDSFVKKVKVEKTTIDIADIRPSSSSAEKEREETAKEPLIDSFVKKVKVEKTTIDIADIRPSSSSAEKEREETAKEPLIDSFVKKVKVEKTTIDIADIRPSSSSAEKEREETAKEPLIDSFVVKVKVEKTTIDIPDIRPSSSSAEKEREETAKIIQKIIALSCKKEQDDEVIVVSEVFKGWDQEFRTVEKFDNCNRIPYIEDEFRGWSKKPDLSGKFKEWYNLQLKTQGSNVGVATTNEDLIGSNSLQTNIGNYVCCKCKGISGSDVNVVSSNSGENQFKCNVCLYVCSSSADLKTHMSIHGQNSGPAKLIEKDTSTKNLEKLDKKLKLNPVVVLDVIADNVLKNNNCTSCSTEESVGDQQYHKKKLNEISVDGNNASKLEHDSRSKNKTFKNSDKVGVKRKLSDENTRVMYVNGKCSIEEYKKQKLARSSLNKYKCKQCCFKSATQKLVADHMKIHLHKKYKDKSNKRSRSLPEEVDEKLVLPEESDTSPVNPNVVQTMGSLLPCTKTKEHNKSDKQNLLDVLETSDSSPNVLPENQTIKSKSDKKNHKKRFENYKISKLSKKKDLLKCLLCNFKSTREKLIQHARVHNYEENKTEKVLAKVKSPNYKDVIKKYKCTDCDNASTRCHSGERPYKCTMCNYSAKSSSGLKTHMYTHSNYKPLKCKMCSYATANSVTLEMHIRTHTGGKPFQCSVCDYSTSRPRNLKMHERIHSGEKPYVCSICQFSCARHGNLVAHIRTHTGERPYECGSCSAKFSTKSALTIHTRIHTGEKPYKCKICSHASYASAELKKHVKRRHEKHLSDNNNS